MSLIPLHCYINRILLCKGCISEEDLINEMNEFNHSPLNTNQRQNEQQLQKMITSINDYLHFIQCDINRIEYDLNHTTYYVFRMLTDINPTANNSSSKMKIKNDKYFNVKKLKLFAKVIQLCMNNYGLISEHAIQILNQSSFLP